MFWLRKITGMLATLLVVSLLTFLILYQLPGDPAVLILGTEADAAALDLVRSQLGLEQSLFAQFGNWLLGILQGDFGTSITISRGYSVGKMILSALPVTIPLAVGSIVLALAVAIPLGVFVASRQGSRLDSIVLTLSQAGLSIPSFWLGILMIQVFAVNLGWFPSGNMPNWTTDPGGAMISLLLPIIVLTLPRAAILTRIVRSSMLEVLGEDYIRAARSKGVPEWLVLCHHALQNALVAISTVAGIQLVQLVAGTVVVEQVFSLPGLGRLILSAVLQRDLPLVQGAIFTGAALILLINFLLDSLYSVIDPQIKRGGGND